jgi:large subunit ribosomal protein L4
MELQSLDNKKQVNLSDKCFGQKFNAPLVHQAVVSYLAGARSGSKAQKNRSDVKGGGRKPYAQKGSGRARAGTIRSPIWRGGGVTFASSPKSFKKKINKKMYRAAMRSILSELLKQKRLHVISSLDIKTPKTKVLKSTLESFSLTSSVLIVTNEYKENLYLSSRNLHSINVCNINELNPVDLVKYENILLLEESIKKIEELFNAPDVEKKKTTPKKKAATKKKVTSKKKTTPKKKAATKKKVTSKKKTTPKKK